MQKEEIKPKKWWAREDSWALIIGGLMLAIGLVFYQIISPNDLAEQHASLNNKLEKVSQDPIQNLDYWTIKDAKADLKMNKLPAAKSVQNLMAKPVSWQWNPLDGLFPSTPDQEKINQAAIAKTQLDSSNQIAFLKDHMAAGKAYADQAANQEAITAIQTWRQKVDNYQNLAKKAKPASFSILKSLLWSLVLLVLFLPAAKFLGHDIKHFSLGFLVVFGLALFSYLMGANVTAKAYGIGYAAWALAIGILISNTLGIPSWLRPALQAPLYIKTGLILLGAEVLFNKVLAIGLPGIFVAWIVTPIVLLTTYWFGQNILKISSKTLNITISADMSVCGVSAAVATAAASGAKKEELTLAIGLSMLFTSVMMIVLPIVINALGMPEVLGGAWIGGTIDATGAVVAAGEFLGDTALSVAATIKMIQNILIGVVAFGVAIYFSRMRGDGVTKTKVGIGEIWRRFPKFILGFIAASLLFSALYSYLGNDVAASFIDHGVIRGYSKNIRGWLFAIAFVSIGLSTNYKELKGQLQGGKPLILYLCGQAFNLALTLLMAYIMFYLVFPDSI